MEIFHKMISAALNLPEKQISNTLGLLAEGATIPFISRYRKEITGGLDEVQIESIKTQYDKLSELAKRKETILGTIGEQGKLTPELRQRIDATWDADRHGRQCPDRRGCVPECSWRHPAGCNPRFRRSASARQRHRPEYARNPCRGR